MLELEDAVRAASSGDMLQWGLPGYSSVMRVEVGGDGWTQRPGEGLSLT